MKLSTVRVTGGDSYPHTRWSNSSRETIFPARSARYRRISNSLSVRMSAWVPVQQEGGGRQDAGDGNHGERAASLLEAAQETVIARSDLHRPLAYSRCHRHPRVHGGIEEQHVKMPLEFAAIGRPGVRGRHRSPLIVADRKPESVLAISDSLN